MLACSGGEPASPADGGRDGGALADVLADVRDALADVVDAELPDAHAGGDGGAGDGGAPACNCVLPQAEYTFSGGALNRGMGDEHPEADDSTAGVTVTRSRAGDGTVTCSLNAGVSYFLRDGTSVYVGCQFVVRADRSIYRRPGQMNDGTCGGYVRGPDGLFIVPIPTTGGVGADGMRVTELTDETVTVVLPVIRLTGQRRPDGGAPVPFDFGSVGETTIRVRAPGSRWLTPPRAYRP